MKDLPEWIQNRIRESRTYQQLLNPPEASDSVADDFSVIDDGDGDIPF